MCKLLDASKAHIEQLEYERDSATRSCELYKVAYETVVSEFVNNKKEESKPTCENCYWYFRNPIGGKPSCEHAQELPEKVCEHYIRK